MFVSVQLLGSGKRAHPCAGVKFLTTVMSFIVLELDFCFVLCP